MRLYVLALAAAMSMTACKSSSGGASTAKDFDTGANPNLSIAYDDTYAFCPAATKFNIVNAYWLTLADAYVYATQANLTAVASQIKTQWSSLTVDFISSPTSANPANPDTQALWIETNDVAILAYRGTPLDRIDAQDIVSDLNAKFVPFDGGGNVHKGFQTALTDVWPQINAKLMGLQGTNKSLFITGHSLGAALATLTTARVLLTDPLKSSIRSNLKGLYTIGSPKVGDQAFATAFTNAAASGAPWALVRTRNHDDIVTRVPTAPYQHVGPLMYLTNDGRMYSQDQNLGYSRYQMPDAIAQGITDTFLVTELTNLTEHVPTNYFKKITAEYMAHKNWVAANNADPCNDDPFYAIPEVIDQGVAPGINKLEDLNGLKNAQLADLFSKGTNDPIPSAATPGVTADGTGLPLIMAADVPLNNLAYNFWEGKKFTTDSDGNTTLVNKLAGDWVDDISATVRKVNPGDSDYVDPGDGKGYILLDYGQSNRVLARSIRDEIRQIAPNLYLGRANIEQPSVLWPILGRYRFVIWFALGFNQQQPGT